MILSLYVDEQVMFMVSFQTFCGCLSMVAIHLLQITCFLGTMLIVVSRALRQYVFFLLTRSNTSSTSFFSEGITNVLQSIVYTDSTMNAKEDIMSSCGRLSLSASTVCLFLLSLMIRSSVCMVDYRLRLRA